MRKTGLSMLMSALLCSVFPATPLLAQVGGGASGSPGAPSQSLSGGNTGTAGPNTNSPVPPPGVNSAGTANSSGGPSSGTVGLGGRPNTSSTIDPVGRDLDSENRDVNSKIKGICRGC